MFLLQCLYNMRASNCEQTVWTKIKVWLINFQWLLFLFVERCIAKFMSTIFPFMILPYCVFCGMKCELNTVYAQTFQGKAFFYRHQPRLFLKNGYVWVSFQSNFQYDRNTILLVRLVVRLSEWIDWIQFWTTRKSHRFLNNNRSHNLRCHPKHGGIRYDISGWSPINVYPSVA